MRRPSLNALSFTISLLLLLAITTPALRADEGKDLKDIQFESLLIQGQIQRPDIAIVTGDPGDEMDGLLRLRKDFVDLMAMEIGEEVQ
jgi:hypothetical protein